MALRLKRGFRLSDQQVPRLVAALDAAYESDEGSGGFCLILDPTTLSELRRAAVVAIPQEAYGYWGRLSTHIAQLEVLMVVVSLVRQGTALKVRRGVWFIALMSLIRGRSSVGSLDQMAMLVHAAAGAFQVELYFDWISSEANWSDKISRIGWADVWLRENGFRRGTDTFPHIIP